VSETDKVVGMKNVAMIVTIDTDSDEEAMREAEALAEGIGQEGENISALGVVYDNGASWTGGDTEILTSRIQSILGEYGTELDDLAEFIAVRLTGEDN
jgi:hypothetical protein